jgi:hypothetical protein
VLYQPFPRQALRLRTSSCLLAAAIGLAACGGGGGSTSAPSTPAPVAVQAAVITTQPASQSVTTGQSVTFSVVASGDGLSYQWQRDGKDIAGATGASYTLANVQATDNGASFTIVVRNAGGSVTSAAATLKVTAMSTPGKLSLLAGPLADSSGNVGGKLNGNADGSGTAARFSYPSNTWPASNLYPDAQGNVFVADGSLVRKITPGGDVFTLALPTTGSSNWPINYYTTGYANGGDLLAFNYGVLSRGDINGNFHFLAGQTVQVGVQPTLTDGMGAKASFYNPRGFVADAHGNVYCIDQLLPRYTDDPVRNYIIRKIATDGTVTTLPVSNMPEVRSWFVDRDGKLVMATAQGAVLRLEADGSLSTLRPAPPAGLTSVSNIQTVVEGDRSGNVYVADYTGSWSEGPESSVLHKITPAGIDTIIAGMPNVVRVVLGSAPGLDKVEALAVGTDGAVYIMNDYSVLKLTQ